MHDSQGLPLLQRQAHRVEEVVEPRPLEHVHVHQPPINLHWNDVVWVWDGLEGGVHQGLIQVKHKGLLVQVIWVFAADHCLPVHARWLWWQLVQRVDQLQVCSCAASIALGRGCNTAQQVPQAVAPAAAVLGLLLLLLELLLVLLFL
jgi:hypothetical protein